MSKDNEFYTAQILLPVSVATAGNSDDVFCINRLGGKSQVTAVDFIANGSVTANDSNNKVFTCTVGGVSIGAMTTSTSGTGDITDGTAASITLSAAGSNLVAEGGVVKVAITIGGSGVAVAGTLAVTMQRVRAD